MVFQAKIQKTLKVIALRSEHAVVGASNKKAAAT